MSKSEKELAEILHKRLGTYKSKTLIKVMKEAVLDDKYAVEVLNELARLVGEEGDFR